MCPAASFSHGYRVQKHKRLTPRKNDGHVNVTREGKKEMNEPEGNVGDQSLAMPKNKTQPKHTKIEWLIKCCDRSMLTANNDESQSVCRN